MYNIYVYINAFECRFIACINYALAGFQDPSKRRLALANLASCRSASLGHGDAICRCLGDEDPLVRWAAIDFFGALKEQARPLAKTAAVQASSSQDGRLRCAAALSLGHIGEKTKCY